MTDGDTIIHECLSPELHLRNTGTRDDSPTLEDLERRHILRVLEHTGGHKVEAACL